MSFDEINAVAGSGGFSDTAANGAATGSVIGLAEAAFTGLGATAAAVTIGTWSAVGGAAAAWGYLCYSGATAAGAGRLGSYLGEVAYDTYSYYS